MPSLEKCPLCGYGKFKQFPLGGFDLYRIKCGRCGSYKITYELILSHKHNIEDRRIGYILSGMARELYELKLEEPEFFTTNLDEHLKNSLIPNINNIGDKAEKILLRLKERTDFFGEEIKLKNLEEYISFGYAKNLKEFEELLNLLEKKDYI